MDTAVAGCLTHRVFNEYQPPPADYLHKPSFDSVVSRIRSEAELE
jgi:hypothetical protein